MSAASTAATGASRPLGAASVGPEAGLADLDRVGAHRLGDVFQRYRAEIADIQIEPRLHLPIGVLREADGAGLGDALQARGDVDAVAHQVAVVLLHDIAEMDGDAEFDASILRHAGVALHHAVLHFDRAPDRVDHAAKLDDRPIAGALDHPALVDSDGGVDEVAPQRPQPRERAVFVCARKPAEADHVGREDRGELTGLDHRASEMPPHHADSTKIWSAMLFRLRYAINPSLRRPIWFD